MTHTQIKQKSEKKFKIIKSPTGRIIYNWAYQCPRCKRVWQYNFDDLWCFEKTGGLGVECECKFGQVITMKDILEATEISNDEFSKLEFSKVKKEEKEWIQKNGRWVLE